MAVSAGITAVVLACAGCTEQYEVFAVGPGGGGAPPTDAGGSAEAGSAPVSPTDGTLGAMNTHTCAVQSGAPWCWGSNAEYALGLLDTQAVAGPTEVEGTPRLVAMGVGAQYACGLDQEGSIWCWGRNDAGQLGSGDLVSRPEPARVELPEPAERVSVGPAHSCAITRTGELWCWGENSERQLGDPDTNENQPLPVQVGTLASWSQVSAGQGHTCAIQNEGSLYCWGRNSQAQLGLGQDAPVQLGEPTLVDDAGIWTRVASDQRCTCAIRDPGTLYCWGGNTDGQLGVGDLASRYVPTRVGTRNDWRRVAVNALHTCALDAASGLWCWGRGAEGQLGLGDTDPRLEPVQVAPDRNWQEVAVGRFYTCARDRGGNVWCTGDGEDSPVLGVPNSTRLDELTPVAGLP